MKGHSFVGVPGKPCATCRRSYKDHSDKAECESCDYIGECYLHESTNMLLCWSCYDKQVQALVNHTEVSAAETRVEAIAVEVIKTDTTIRYNGDFYNAKTTAIIELKKQIDADESIVDKQKAFQDALAERHSALQNVIFEADRTKYEASLEQLAIAKTLREYGDELRKEIREQLRANDANYQPVAPKIVAKPKLAKKTPLEKLIETLALAKGISHTEAKLMIEKGMGAKE